MDFISKFIEFTKEFESPTNFWRWSAYSIVAAVLRDNVYFDHGLRRTYPNIYVVLLADSAHYRKSGPFPTVASLLKELKCTKTIRGRASVQAILEVLSQVTGSGGTQIQGGSCLLIAEELASFFVSDPALVPLITDMYDYRDEFPYTLRSSTITVKNLCVSMLAASNETFLREVYTNAAVYGGLLGRTFMVKPDETREPNALLEINPNDYDTKDLIGELNKIRLLRGPVTTTQDARIFYEIWYKNLYHSYSKINDRTGVTQRMHTGVLKLAIIIAAAHGTKEINEIHMREAVDKVTGLKSNYEVYAMSSGKGTQAEIGAMLLNSLWNAPKNEMSRADVLRFHWNTMSADELDSLVQTLSQGKLIEMTMQGQSTIIYRMTDLCKGIFLKRAKGENGGNGNTT